ncbi:MAG: cytochrome c oxidase subunit II [Anaerolineales bacterium]|nr:cytochrome c oxidase subunit II [Anaerolineales bacterium]
MMHIDRSERMFFIGSAVLLVVFALAVGISGFAYNVQVPQPVGRVDPQTIATPGASEEFPLFGAAEPEDRIRQISEDRYEVYILAQMWKFSPGSVFYGEPPITVPAGSTVTFYLTSKDVQHGFRVVSADGETHTNINMMVLPGEVSRLTATFEDPGTYHMICHEYCGTAHQTMFGVLEITE